jgi:FkbM family methyltransferase
MKIKNFYNHYRLLKAKGLSLMDKIGLHSRKRYTPFEIKFFGKKIKAVDAPSFLGMFNEIYLDEHYKFNSDTDSPLVIDCGTNIGMADIYFKQQHPNAVIIGFEADPEIASIASENISKFGLKDVEIQAKVVWIHDHGVHFQTEGGTSGRMSHESSKRLPSIRLRDELSKYPRIDFLKMDIEGAEFEVIKDAASELFRVQNIFIEYHSIEGEEQKLGDLLNILRDTGFRYHVKEAYTTVHPYIERDLQLGMDLQLNIFGWR